LRKNDLDSSVGAISKTGKRRKSSRDEKSQALRKALFDAAVKVVGTFGYAKSKISAVADEANVAQGTFYNYFESREALFDELLPALGEELLNYISAQTADAENFADREIKSFRAFFSFLKIRPEFYRILYEAEVFAPEAYQRHMDRVANGYVRTLKRAAAHGELREADTESLAAVSYILMGARHYLCMRYARAENEMLDLPDWVLNVYVDRVVNGIYIRPRADGEKPAS
jgi:AcrR family transcriptional regulator